MTRPTLFTLSFAVLAVLGACALASTVVDPSSGSALAVLTHGSRRTLGLVVGIVGVALTVGLTAGWLASESVWADAVLARSTELAATLPSVVVLAVLAMLPGAKEDRALFVVLATLRAIEIARVTRAQALTTSAEGFVQAARALGLPRGRVWRAHVAPEILPAVLVSAAFSAPAIVAIETAASALGLGLGAPSWGSALAGGSLPVAAIAGSAAVLATAAFYVIADGIADRLDPCEPVFRD